MKEFKTIISILLVLAMLAGIITVGFAQDGEPGIPEDPSYAENGGEVQPVPVEVGETNPGDEADAKIPVIEPEVRGEEGSGSEEAKEDGGILSGLKALFFNGVPTLTTSTFVKVTGVFRFIKYLLTGRILTGSPKHFDVTMDEDVIAVCAAISDQSALDVYQLLTNLPDLSDPARIANTVFKIDTAKYREQLYEARDNYYREGNSALAGICWLIGSYMSGIESAYVHLEPKDNYQEIVLDVTYSDGTVEVFHPEIYIDTETGECFGRDEKGMMGIGFNCNAYDALVYAPMYCWMKNFGFCVEYDMLCYALPVYCYNTRRFKFEYDNREWMIQIWKGNYLITNGGEVGIYNRDKGSFGTFYNVVSEEEEMPMSLQITHGDEVLVDIPEQMHWWVNGFKLGRRLYSPHTLQMKFTILFPNEEMLSAFTASVDRNLFHDVTYEVDGLRVTAQWNS